MSDSHWIQPVMVQARPPLRDVLHQIYDEHEELVRANKLLVAALREHHAWRMSQSIVTFPRDRAPFGTVIIDVSDAYARSSLCAQTILACHVRQGIDS